MSNVEQIFGMDQVWGALDPARRGEQPVADMIRRVLDAGPTMTDWEVPLVPRFLATADLAAAVERCEKPDLLDIEPPILPRYLARITIGTQFGCWNMPAYDDPKLRARYPEMPSRFTPNGKEGGHRVFYRAFVGAIPPGYFIDHRCLNKTCVYPRHVEPTTHAENNRRARQDTRAKGQPSLFSL